jgi:hypothetical protein
LPARLKNSEKIAFCSGDHTFFRGAADIFYSFNASLGAEGDELPKSYFLHS